MTIRFLSLAVFLVAPVVVAREIPGYATYPFLFRGPVERIVPADVDGDGLKDVISAAGNRLHVFFQDAADGFTLNRPSARLRLPGEAAGWDLLPRAGGNGLSIVALVDGRTIRSWSVDREAGRVSEPVVLLDGLRGYLPRGVRYLRFVNDINGDGRADLVIPAAGLFHVYVGDADGGFKRGPTVKAAMQLTSELEGEADMTVSLGQSLRIPFLKLRDVNGDGISDLIAETEDSLEVYLARPGGPFPSDPTFSMNLAAVRARLGSFDPDRLDLSNLTGVVALTCQTIMEDVTGDGKEDLLLRAGGKVSLFLGGPDGMNVRRPHQILKSAGNVVTALLHDEDENGRKDLWLVRIEAVSIGDVFTWLVVSGSVDFEAFLYRNEGERFARRPARKITITLRFPSLPSLIRLGDRVKEKKKQAKKEKPRIPTARARVTGGEDQEDLLALLPDKLVFYRGGAGPRKEMGSLGELLDYRRDKDEYLLDVEELADRFAVGAASSPLDALRDRKPDLELPLKGSGEGSSLVILELNGDGHDDALVIQKRDSLGVWGAALLSKKPKAE